MAWSFDKVSLLKLSGARSVLGIDLGEKRARIVELRAKGGLVNKFRARFRVAQYFTVGFGEGMDPRAKARCLSEALTLHGVKARYACSSVQGAGVRTVTAEIPRSMSQDVSSWIADHAEKLVRIPVPVKELFFGYEILAQNETSLQAEITFVRKDEVKGAEAFFADAGLLMLSLTTGVRDVLNPLLYEEEFLRSERYEFAWLESEDAHVAEYENRKRTRTIVRVPKGECDLTFSSSLHVAGETSGVTSKHVAPFFAPSEYMLAIGCALKGWLSELHTVSFHTEEYEEKKKEALGKALFYRVTILAGLLLALLLGAETVGGIMLDHFYEKCDRTLLESGVNYAELNRLEKDTHDLKEELEKAGSLAYRSDYARVLHEVARLTPQGVWLYKLRIDGKDAKNVSVMLTGSACSSERVSSLLQALEATEIFKDVRLVKSGVAETNPSEAASAGTGSAAPGVMTFEITLRRR